MLVMYKLHKVRQFLTDHTFGFSVDVIDTIYAAVKNYLMINLKHLLSQPIYIQLSFRMVRIYLRSILKSTKTSKRGIRMWQK